MNWLMTLCNVPCGNVLDVSIPKEKIIQNIKSNIFQNKVSQELQNIQDIIYRAIFRNKSDKLKNELHIIEIELNKPKNVKIIAEAFQKAIPYSKILIFSSGDKYLLFHANQFDKSIMQNQFSNWIYKEEMYLYASNSFFSYFDVHQNSYEKITDHFVELFSTHDEEEYICLRHLIDDLRIHEEKDKSDYVYPVIQELISQELIEYFNGEPFVSFQNCINYLLQKTHSYWSDTEDKRFGIDNKYELLNADDFATVDSTINLIDKLRNKLWLLKYNTYSSDND